jgi:hypothetical protein
VTLTKNRARDYGLELEFRRAVRQVPSRQRPGLRAWLRRYRRHRSRTFYELDPANGEWRRV